jgi:RHS repeat-associated protein
VSTISKRMFEWRSRTRSRPRLSIATRAKFAALLLLLVAVGTTATGHAQSCSSPVDHWTGTYTITGTGSSACVDSDAQCVTNESAKATVRMGFAGVSCSTAVWSSQPQDPKLTVSVNDTLTASCPESGTTVETITSVGPQLSESTLTVHSDTAKYTFWPLPLAIVGITVVDCDGSQITVPPGGGYGLSGVPPIMFDFSLPASVRTLSHTATVQGQANGDGLATFHLNFSLEPHYHTDDDCQKNGNSTLGCMNQTLGEDVPITGTDFSLHYDSGRSLAAGASSAVTGYTAMFGGWTLSAHHAYDASRNILFLGDGRQRNSWRMGPPIQANGTYLLTAEDGSEVYVFDATSGLHTQTRWPLTGAVRYQFGYDAGGELTSVTDAAGNITTIQRDVAENVTAIVSPYGVKTTLKVDKNGFLKTITDPAGNKVTLTTGTTGLVTARTDANGTTFHYAYDTLGGLVQDSDPLGSTALARTAATTGLGQTVSHTTPLGRTTSYQTALDVPWTQSANSTVNETQTVTWPSGLIATSSMGTQVNQLTQAVTLPDGSGESVTLVPDAHWGLQAPFPQQATFTMGSQTASLSGTTSASLANASDPFSLLTQSATTTINSRTYSSVYSAASSTITNTTPVGRTRTQTLDALERVTNIVDGGQTAVRLAYDDHGRLHSVTRGTRHVIFSYESHGYLSSANNGLAQKTSYKYDRAGRLASVTAPDTGLTAYQYDGNGNLTSVTPPGQPAHAFAYSNLSLLTSYTPPALAGTGPTTFEFNADRDLTRINRPDGGVINFGYDTAGRPSSIATPTATLNYQYDVTSGNVVGETIATGESIAYAYDGPVLISETFSGPVSGAVQTGHDNNGWGVSESVNSANTITVAYDNDGLPTQAGALTIKRSPASGFITSTKLGSASDTRSYSALGELASYTATYGGQTLYSLGLTRDGVGRIASKTETISGVAHTWAYQYDPAGRLIQVSLDGSVAASYAYDTNSNRLSSTGSGGTLTATHDVQDRLLTYGSATYTYAAAGELSTQVKGGGTTSYTYDALGNLLSVHLPGGSTITYIVDGENRRTGKRLNGSTVAGYLYSGARLVAQLDAANAVISRFVYGTSSVVPDYMVRAGVTYRIFSDPLGSPRLVVNTSNGQIAERIDYDEFGKVTNDTAPGFIPFGFAGGLYDPDTGLVRLGMRDYDAGPGRWTAKDPWLIAGGDTNFYAYAGNDPVNNTDPSGLRCKKCEEKKKIGVKDLVDTSKQIDKVADLVQKDSIGDAVKKGVGDAAKNESPMSGSASKDYKRAVKEVDKSIPFIQKFLDQASDIASSCIVQLTGGDEPPEDPSSKSKNQPPVQRGDPPPKWTPTDAARTGAKIGSGY